jgi:HEAT repeat protein
MLRGGDCPKLASQALFILAQSNSTEAHELMAKIARGESNPDLQRKAIQNLALFGGSWGRQQLAQLYGSLTDFDMKKRVLNAFMLQGAKTEVITVAKSEKNPELRAEGIKTLGLMGAREEIWQMYQGETDVVVKKQILQALWLAGDHAHVCELAHNEKDKTLKLTAINDLGLLGRSSEECLIAIYNADNDYDVRKKVINALFLAGDCHGLVTLARKETDPNVRKVFVSQLSIMSCKEGTDYLLEILNK